MRPTTGLKAELKRSAAYGLTCVEGNPVTGKLALLLSLVPFTGLVFTRAFC